MGLMCKTTIIVIFTICLIVSNVNCQFGKCDFYQKMEYGRSYEFANPNFPYNYNGVTNCRWASVSPVDSTINLNCNSVRLPSSNKCNNDRLEVSLTGRSDLGDAMRFCGTGSFNRTSKSNQLVVALRSPNSNSMGGTFECSIRAIKNKTPEPQPSCMCGRRKTGRIVGGNEAGINEFTMMAGVVDVENREITCGATIISNYYSTTAAHCVRLNRQYALVVGEHDVKTGSESAFTVLHQLAEIRQHQQYNHSTNTNDIALLKTVRMIIFNDGVGPACLPFKFTQQSFENSIVETAGWGTLQYGGPRPQKLMKVSLSIISLQQCRVKYPDVNNLNICTLSPEKDSCQYDSGGALYYTDTNGLLYQIGVLNYGIGCAFRDTPGVSLRLTEYLNWIMDNTQGEKYCYR